MLETDEVKAYEAFKASGSVTVETVAVMNHHQHGVRRLGFCL